MKTQEIAQYKNRIGALQKGNSALYEENISRLNLLLKDIEQTHDTRIEEDLTRQLNGLLLTTEELKEHPPLHK